MLFVSVNMRRMTHHQHGVCVVFICLGVLCHLALCIENNDSRLVHLPKEEFIKVMSEIVSGGDKNTTTVAEPSSSEDGEFYDPVDPSGLMSQPSTQRSTKSSYRTVNEETPRTTATREAQNNPGNGLSMGENNPALGKRAKRARSDSLYFLQRSMEQREKQYREGQNLTARTDDSEYDRAENNGDGSGFMQYS
jgi:hypothetical protein